MGNLLFECQTQYSKEIINEYVNFYYKRSKSILILMILISILIIIAGIFIAAFNGDNQGLTVGLAIFLLAGTFALIFFRNIKLSKKTFYEENSENNNGEEIVQVSQFFESGIIRINPLNGNKYEYPYNIITEITESKNLLLIRTKAKQVFILEKTKFTVGNAEGLMQFIETVLDKE